MQFKSCAMINGLYLNINGSVDTEGKMVFLCCENVPNRPGVAIKYTPGETLEAFLGMRSLVIAESLKNAGGGETWEYTVGCQKCANYCKAEQTLGALISYVNLSMYPAPCQCRCIYCTVRKQWNNTPEVNKGYKKVLETLSLGKRCGIIQSDAVWQISTGEITIHPYKEKIMQLVRGQRAIFYTNAFLYDDDIAQNLHENSKSGINLSIDAGTPQTWKKVKGFDNFEQVTENLVRYYKQSVRPGQIALKYIVLPDVNDTYEDYSSLVEIMRILEVGHLSISRDVRNKYDDTATQEDRTKLCSAAAYLLAICCKTAS